MPFGAFWSRLKPSGTGWSRLEPSRAVWAVCARLGPCGPSGAAWGSVGPPEAVCGRHGPSVAVWITSVHSGVIRDRLDRLLPSGQAGPHEAVRAGSAACFVLGPFGAVWH